MQLDDEGLSQGPPGVRASGRGAAVAGGTDGRTAAGAVWHPALHFHPSPTRGRKGKGEIPPGGDSTRPWSSSSRPPLLALQDVSELRVSPEDVDSETVLRDPWGSLVFQAARTNNNMRSSSSSSGRGFVLEAHTTRLEDVSSSQPPSVVLGGLASARERQAAGGGPPAPKPGFKRSRGPAAAGPRGPRPAHPARAAPRAQPGGEELLGGARDRGRRRSSSARRHRTASGRPHCAAGPP